MRNKILHGDALSKLKELDSESVDCVMTSPPYWALRDYGIDGQVGLEPSFEEHINKMCDIFDEVKRVLKKTGTCWVNYGDTYSGAPVSGSQGGFQGNITRDNPCISNVKKPKTLLPNKCLTMIPFRFAIEMVNRGWILRNVIIWYKRNCMPSSAKDRLTVDFEYVFFFSKSKRYYFKQQFDKVITKDNIIRDRDTTKMNNTPGRTRMGGLKTNDYDFRNKRCVWKIATQPFPKAHFATYPEELCETPIKAGCPKEVCVKCGTPKENIIDSSERVDTRPANNQKDSKSGKDIDPNADFHNSNLSRKRQQIIYKEKGYKTCNCKAVFKAGIVLDPFFGSGTTGLVALKNARDFLGIELNQEYIKIAEKRLKSWINQSRLVEF